MNNLYRKIYKKIKAYDTIVIARHIGPDPDALGSSLGLKEAILNTFPNKKVFAVGSPASKFKYIGNVDKFNESMYEKSLLIILDTPDLKRVDGVDPSRFEYKIKIDHHPNPELYCDIEWSDDTASSASQLIMELIFNTKLKLSVSTAEKLYIGLIGDTNRFLYYYTTPKTFSLVSRLIEETHMDFTKLYESIYLRPLKEKKFESYLISNLKVTKNGFGYVLLDEKTLEEQGVDAATAGNMVNNFNYIEEVLAWGVFSYDKANDNIRGSIRSRGPIINKVASLFGGGGHIYASGVRVPNFDVVNELVEELDKACLNYIEENK